MKTRQEVCCAKQRKSEFHVKTLKMTVFSNSISIIYKSLLICNS